MRWLAISALLVGCAPPVSDLEVELEEPSWEELAPSVVAVAATEDHLARGPLESGAQPPELGGVWVHPLAGPRILPTWEGRRFGARRPGDRPDECGRGHCGVDLGHERGAVVHAAASGIVRRAQRESRGRAGRFVRIEHSGGARTDYMHLDVIRGDLVPGMRVAAGEPIGTVGTTGVHFSGPHLHFALAYQTGEGWVYVDPDPILRRALVHTGPASLGEHSPAAIAAAATPRLLDRSGGIDLEIVDGHTGRLVDGVRVSAAGPDGALIERTARGGRVAIYDLVPGRWTLSLRGRSYAPARASFEVPAGATRRSLTVTGATVELRQGATLAGVVRDENGDRIAGASVRVGELRATTDSQGRFRLAHCSTGEVELVASLDEVEARSSLSLVPGEEQLTLQVALRLADLPR